jgi:hypothetical protein
MPSDALNNLELWQSVEMTDPKHVKPITGKSYNGSSPSPYWLVKKATETFGPCGIGWGFTVIDERIEVGTEPSDRVSFARVRVWYEWKGKRGEVEHVGGTTFSGRRKPKGDQLGALFSDEDAPKKSVTDALTKALSMIGFAGDIFSGRWDDSKYQAELREEYAERTPESLPATEVQIAALIAEMRRTGRGWKRILGHYGVKTQGELSSEQVLHATAVLKGEHTYRSANGEDGDRLEKAEAEAAKASAGAIQ